MTPEVLARLETFAARTLKRTRRRVNALVESDCRRIFERLPTDAALARIVAVVPVQVVLLEVDLQLKADVADVAAVHGTLAAGARCHGDVCLQCGSGTVASDCGRPGDARTPATRRTVCHTASKAIVV